jgi:deoxyhypusine monooxygenase
MREPTDKSRSGKILIENSWPAFMKLRAINAIINDRLRSSVPQLIELLRSDPNPIVRHESAFALGELGYREAIADLQRSLLGDPDTIVRHEAAFGLGLMKLEEALSVLRSAPDDPEEVVRETVKIAIDNLEFDLGLMRDESESVVG